MGPLLMLSWWGCTGEGPAKDEGPGTDLATSFADTPDQVPGAPILPRDCDAGDAAWVSRAMPLLWGRRPHGAAEIELWAQMASEHGREATVRAMTLDQEYYLNWYDWFTDALYVARTGDKEYGSCFAQLATGPHNGQLTAFLRDNGPDEAFPERFNMADVLLDALTADDVSVIYRTWLFARMNRPTTGANVSAEELEYNRRVNFGELFYRTYLGRNLDCLLCHNSAFSVTDAPAPMDDRTWQLPGHFETALLGSPAGRSAAEAYAMFRYNGVVLGGFGGGGGPGAWGMDNDCGRFVSPANLPGNDMLGQETAYFVQSYGPSGSIYDLERHLAAGVASLKGSGLQVGSDGSLDGQQAFAYLLAASLANQVWATATGYELVVAHHFPRNQGQMLRLQRFADTLVESGFSLRDLLVEVTTDPYFNPGLPLTCEAMPYGLDPVFDPWTTSDEDPYRRRNGASDAVHRLPARALLRSAHANLGWRPRTTWFDYFGGGEEEEFQSAVGVFLRESDPGHRGTDFQGLLAFETELGTCAEPVQGTQDFIDAVLQDAVSRQATVGDVAAALKDRLVASTIEPEEQALIEALLGRSFSDPADASLEARLRLFCGTLLMSPQFQLVTDPELGAIPLLASGVEADCERVASLMTTSGIEVTCQGTTLQ